MPQMSTEGVRQRNTMVQPTTKAQPTRPNLTRSPETNHPGGPKRHGSLMQTIRAILFILYFLISAIFIHGAQLLGSPLYLVNKDYFYAWMAMTKQHFGLFGTTGTQWWSPTVIRISGDASIAGQLHQAADGRLECHFPDRVILIANHQIYTEWLYLWWVAYTAGFHGHVYIILKESLKYVPIIGPAMMFYNFIFMSRKWVKDQARLRYRLEKLNTRHSGPMSGASGAAQLDPMWLLIFPEGTNLSANTRSISKRWSEKSGIPDMKHCLLPRSTGLQFCLQELADTVEWVYDCTIGYEGIPEGEYGGNLFTLRSVYLEGRPPKSVNMHWRRFKVSDIPTKDHKATEEWILERWREKDDLLDHFQQTGRFPADEQAIVIEASKEKNTQQYIETEVKPKQPFEILQIITPVGGAFLVVNILLKLVRLVSTGRF